MSDVILFINRSDSKCGACGGDADPREKAHVQPMGYAQRPGCGAVWSHVGSQYRGAGIEETSQEMRPDLIWTDQVSIGRKP